MTPMTFKLNIQGWLHVYKRFYHQILLNDILYGLMNTVVRESCPVPSAERFQRNFLSLNAEVPATRILPHNKEQCHMIQKHTESLAERKSFRIHKRVPFKNLTWNRYDPVSQSHNHKQKNITCLVLDPHSLHTI